VTPKEFVNRRDKRGDAIYLPRFMRDFHDQKELFKDIQTFVEKRKKAEPNYTYLDGLTWVAAHVYVVDFFLWFMAQHGYTLQKTRVRGVEFHDINEELEANRKRRFEEYAKRVGEPTDTN
jgi:hypothetical protein